MAKPQHDYVELGNGFFAQRDNEGTVTLLVKEERRITAPTVASVRLDSDNWVKLVAAVSNRGLAPKTIDEAKAFHTERGRAGEFANPERFVQPLLSDDEEIEDGETNVLDD